MTINDLGPIVVAAAGKILAAGLVVIIGLKAVNLLVRFLKDRMGKSGVDASLSSFLIPLIKIALQGLILVTAASMLGVEMTSFVALIGAIGFAIGLALQGSLSNFAGGVLILLLKPFGVGDVIEAQGFIGTVKEIQIFYTVLNTADNRRIVIPNSDLSNGSTINYSAYPTRRLDLQFGVSYLSDISKVKEVLQRIAAENPKVNEEPAPMVVLAEHADSAIVFYLRVWCATADYWPLRFELMEQVKIAFDNEGIEIPYPQMDVHLAQN